MAEGLDLKSYLPSSGWVSKSSSYKRSPVVIPIGTRFESLQVVKVVSNSLQEFASR